MPPTLNFIDCGLNHQDIDSDNFKPISIFCNNSNYLEFFCVVITMKIQRELDA